VSFVFYVIRVRMWNIYSSHAHLPVLFGHSLVSPWSGIVSNCDVSPLSKDG
jgi:hypothetical protein